MSTVSRNTLARTAFLLVGSPEPRMSASTAMVFATLPTDRVSTLNISLTPTMLPSRAWVPSLFSASSVLNSVRMVGHILGRGVFTFVVLRFRQYREIAPG